MRGLNTAKENVKLKSKVEKIKNAVQGLREISIFKNLLSGT